VKRCCDPVRLSDGARGSVLLLCLIFLLVFSFMSAAGIERALLDARMADNLREYHQVRLVAEQVLGELVQDLISGQAPGSEVPGQSGTVILPPYQVPFLVEDTSDSGDPGAVVRLQVQVFLGQGAGQEAGVEGGPALIELVAVLARQCLDGTCSWYRKAWYTSDEIAGK